jgi:nucleoside-diphosphate-sugar epimerase
MSDKNPSKKLFCFGYGYVAQQLAKTLKEQDPSWEICGTTRDLDKLQMMRQDGVKGYIFSDKAPLSDALFTLQGVTHMLMSIPPNKNGGIVFQLHARDILKVASMKWIGMCSSTSVYGDRNGEWVDENSEIRPTSERGTKRARAESAWLKMRRIAGIPINIFRISGIYGPGRSAIDTVRAGNPRRIDKPGHAFNRVHVDDIVQVMIASMDQPSPGDIYNLADDAPVQSHELVDYACQLLGRPSPPLIPYSEVDMAPMARSFYKENKRIKNDRIKEKLGIKLKYPNYKDGLDAIFEQG